ncbi:hypothetical protein U9M48_033627 [Paspalum notatum var. saurae]|uniref:Uncharacterized protein n=1 Tax=Paspalum notatum var. saurae TaxID=547442 RepID=A0AAQ3X6E3_PASNO
MGATVPVSHAPLRTRKGSPNSQVPSQGFQFSTLLRLPAHLALRSGACCLGLGGWSRRHQHACLRIGASGGAGDCVGKATRVNGDTVLFISRWSGPEDLRPWRAEDSGSKLQTRDNI